MSDEASYAEVLATVARVQTLDNHEMGRLLIRGLKAKSDMLQRLTSDFLTRFPRLKIISFFELYPTRPLHVLVGIPPLFTCLAKLTFVRLLKGTRRCSVPWVNTRGRSLRTTIDSARLKENPTSSYVYGIISRK
jgi:hypothetical protein